MSWRPKDWKYGAWQEAERFLGSPPIIVEERLYNAYESGADAILEALRKNPVDQEQLRLFYKETLRDVSSFRGESGKLVFIPDERALYQKPIFSSTFGTTASFVSEVQKVGSSPNSKIELIRTQIL